jgi:hypothetical protein
VRLVLPPRLALVVARAVVRIEVAPRQTGDLMPTQQLPPISLLKVKSSAAPYINDANCPDYTWDRDDRSYENRSPANR